VGRRPRVLISDGAHNFGIATRKEWYSRSNGNRTVHVRDICLGEVHNKIYDMLMI
jgi:hypothetical protein